MTLEKIVDQIVRDNADRAEQARKNHHLMGWFIGKVMIERADGNLLHAMREDALIIGELVFERITGTPYLARESNNAA
jgi:hypothetical protein